MFLGLRRCPLTTPPRDAAPFDTALRSDFVFWAAIRLAPRTVLRAILATPPAVVEAASGEEGSASPHDGPSAGQFTPDGLLNDAAVTLFAALRAGANAAPTLLISVEDTSSEP